MAFVWAWQVLEANADSGGECVSIRLEDDSGAASGDSTPSISVQAARLRARTRAVRRAPCRLPRCPAPGV